MKPLSDKAVKALSALLDVVGEHAHGERGSINVWTEELNALVGGPAKVPFRDETALRECVEWCKDNGLPLLTMMISADKDGIILDQFSCKLAFKHNINPGALKMKEAWVAERKIIAALDTETVALAKEELHETVELLSASKEPRSRRALANARNQEIEAKTLDEWLQRYQTEILDVVAPGQPLIDNAFLDTQEGYKARAWEEWSEARSFDPQDAKTIGNGYIVSKLQPTLNDNRANWITKRYGSFDLKAKLETKKNGIEEFERAAYDFYTDNLIARVFFEKAVSLLGRQYSVVSHLMFLKDKDAYIPVKPDAFEAGLRKLGIEFYLSGYCSWDNYTKFLGYLERIRQMLLKESPRVTLLDAHSILWIIGSGYWFDGEGARKLEKVRAGELSPDQLLHHSE